MRQPIGSGCATQTVIIQEVEVDARDVAAKAVEAVERAHIRVSSRLIYHEGYWVGKVENPRLPFPVEVINDMHIDAYTRRVTVYAQSRVKGKVLVPGPGG